MDDSTALLLGCGCALIVAAVAAVGGWLVRGSTAVPAAVWAVAAAGSLAAELAVRAAGGLADPAAAAAVRLMGLALAVCPVMSLLGAKRPQHGVWQFIVASLGVVLALPALSATLVRPGTPPDVHMLERGFLLVLIVVGWMNFIGTRHAVSATLVTAGLVVLARAVLPLVPARLAEARAPQLEAAACGALAIGAVVAAVQSARAAWRPLRPGSPPSIAPLIDRPYAALRETLGAAWTLRIAERFNAVATERGWPCRLSFHGLEVGGDPDDTDWHRDAMRALRALFRRFVTTAWLARHGWPEDASAVAPLKEGR
ncbi:MAG: hypothetical protein ACKOOF_04280 [Planctomycetaceae bacterium]